MAASAGGRRVGRKLRVVAAGLLVVAVGCVQAPPRDGSVRELRAELERLEQRNASHTKYVEELRHKLTQRQARLQEMTKAPARLSDLMKALKWAEFLHDDYLKRHGELLELPSGVVLRVKKTELGTFVTISVGSEHGVRVGDQYHLSRGGKYVGRIKLIRVSKNSAWGRVDGRWKGQAFPPQTNDKAWTE